MPTDYMDGLSNAYAQSNIWAKTQIHLRLREQEVEHLETVRWITHHRIEVIVQEADRVCKAAEEMELKRHVLEKLYAQEKMTASSRFTAQASLAGQKSMGARSTGPNILALPARQEALPYLVALLHSPLSQGPRAESQTLSHYLLYLLCLYTSLLLGVQNLALCLSLALLQ